jgi:hypothetical protein
MVRESDCGLASADRAKKGTPIRNAIGAPFHYSKL